MDVATQSWHSRAPEGRGSPLHSLDAIAVRRRASRILAPVVLCGSFAIVSCGEGKRPFLMVQVCIRGGDLTEFRHLMYDIAQSEGMTYTDGSAGTAQSLKIIQAPTQDGPVLDVEAESADGVSFGAGNLGLPYGQAAIGFQEGSDPVRARRIANLVATRLTTIGRVETVPGNRGALPIPDCLGKPKG